MRVELVDKAMQIRKEAIRMLLRRQVCELTLHGVLKQSDATLAQSSDTWRSRRDELLQMPRWRPMHMRAHKVNNCRRLTAAS